MSGTVLFRHHGASQRWLINQIPFDGCLIIFNGNHHSWRARAHEAEALRVNQFQVRERGQGRGPDVCDIYITWRE